MPDFKGPGQWRSQAVKAQKLETAKPPPAPTASRGRPVVAHRYSDDQARDYHGRWDDGGGGEAPAPAVPATREGQAEANLQSVLDRAKAAGTYEDDKAWYEKAHDLVGEHAAAAGIPPATFAGMVAATSPQCLWQSQTGRLVNIELAEKAGRTADANPGQTGKEVADASSAPGMLRNSLAAAINIHNGVPVEQVLNGPKTRSFYNNLIDPAGTKYVTIDTHMARAMAGDHNLDSKGISQYTAGKNYAWASDRVRNVAAANGIAPAEAQAAIWEQWRKESL